MFVDDGFETVLQPLVMTVLSMTECGLRATGLGSWTDVRHTFDGCNLVYDRPDNTILFHGDDGVMDRALNFLDVLGIEHRLILRH